MRVTPRFCCGCVDGNVLYCGLKSDGSLIFAPANDGETSIVSTLQEKYKNVKFKHVSATMAYSYGCVGVDDNSNFVYISANTKDFSSYSGFSSFVDLREAYVADTHGGFLGIKNDGTVVVMYNSSVSSSNKDSSYIEKYSDDLYASGYIVNGKKKAKWIVFDPATDFMSFGMEDGETVLILRGIVSYLENTGTSTMIRSANSLVNMKKVVAGRQGSICNFVFGLQNDGSVVLLKDSLDSRYCGGIDRTFLNEFNGAVDIYLNGTVLYVVMADKTVTRVDLSSSSTMSKNFLNLKEIAGLALSTGSYGVFLNNKYQPVSFSTSSPTTYQTAIMSDSNWRLQLDYNGLLKTNTPVNLQTVIEVDGITITGTEPENTQRRLVFGIDSKYYKLTNNSGTSALTEVATQAITSDSVLAEGNTATEIAAITNNSVMAGKMVYPAIAMQATDGASMPTLKIAFNVKTNQDQYTHSEYSPEYTLASTGKVEIYDIDLATTTAEGGTVNVMASLYDGSAWGEYIPVATIEGQSAQKVRFRADYGAQTIGKSIARVNHLYVFTKSNAAILGSSADIITKTETFDVEMTYARLFVKHRFLQDAKVKAYVSMKQVQSKRDNITIGTGTGSTQTIKLADTGIDWGSVSLSADKTAISTFDFSSIDNSVTFTAPAGSTIFGSYSYGSGGEDWREMEIGSCQQLTNGDYMTDFSYTSTGIAKGVGTIRINLLKNVGSITDEIIGVGTGISQLIYINHLVQPETIQLTAADIGIPRENWSYDQVTHLLKLVCLKDATIKLSCTYDGETPVATGFVAAFNQ